MKESNTPSSRYYRLASEALQRGEFDKAKEICIQAIGEFELAGADPETAIACHLLGEIAYIQGEFGEAETWFLKALSIDDRNGASNEQGYARTCHNLAAVLKSTGRNDAAEELLWKSIRIKEQLGDEAGISASYIQLGIVAKKESDIDTAKRRFLDSLAIVEQLGDVPGMVHAILNLSRIANLQDDSDTVEKWHENLKNVLAAERRVPVVINLGEKAQQAGEGQSAKIIYQAALEIADKLNDDDSRSISLAHLGDLACEMGEYALAKDYYDRSIAIDEQLGAKTRAAASCLKLGELYLRSGDDTQRDFQIARKWLQKGLAKKGDFSWWGIFKMHVYLFRKWLQKDKGSGRNNGGAYLK